MRHDYTVETTVSLNDNREPEWHLTARESDGNIVAQGDGATIEEAAAKLGAALVAYSLT